MITKKQQRDTEQKNFFVGAVLLDNKERIYLVKEDDKNKIGKDRWNLPGGSVDKNESLTDAIIREVREETGYAAKPVSVLGCYLCKKYNNLWIYIVFEVKLKNRSDKITDSDIKKGKWFSKNEFLHLDSEEIVHPDMHLVYNIAIRDNGLSIDSVKFIDYDVQ